MGILFGGNMNFNKYFSSYNVNGIVQKKAAETLSKMLSEDIEKCDNILEIGCGTGFFTRELIKKVRSSSLTVNDLFDTRNYLNDIQYKEFLHGDMKKFLNKKYDYIVSSSCFQWSDNLDELLKLISLCSKNLVFSIYLKGNMKEIKSHFGVGLKYYNKDEITFMLKRYFKNVSCFEEEIVLSFDNPFEVLQHIKMTGTALGTGVPISKIKSYRGTKLTYKIGYFKVSL